MLNQKVPIRQGIVIDQLDAILAAAIDIVAADDDIQSGPGIIVQPDLDPVVVAVAHDVVLDNHLGGTIQIHGIIRVVVKHIVTADTATGPSIVDGILVAHKIVVQNVELGTSADAVIPVLDGEADDLGLGAGRRVDGDRRSRPPTPVDDGLLNKVGVLGGVKL